MKLNHIMFNSKKEIRRIAYFLISILLFFSSLTPQAFCGDGDSFELISRGTERLMLNNGLNIILKEDRRSPTVAVNVLVNVGSAAEGVYAGSGITHFIEHMMFKGTESIDAAQLENEFKALGAEIGAYTTFDYTSFRVLAPKESLQQILFLLTDIFKNPAFTEEEFEKEKQVITGQPGGLPV